MKPLIFTPHPALRPYIQHYAYLELGKAEEWNPSHLAPTGCTILTYAHKREEISLQENNDPATRFERLAFTGQATQFKAVHVYGRMKTFFVIFKPCGAYQLLGIRQDEVADRCINLSDILGPSIRLLIDKLSAQNHVRKLRPVMENFLLRPLIKSKLKDGGTRLSHTLEKLKSHSHINNNLITTICREYGYSLSGLERQMQEFVGIGPKLFQRIARFNAALEYMSRMRFQCNWAQVAYQFGYCDQAHFIKEFKLFYGKTPGISAPDDPFISKTVFRKGLI